MKELITIQKELKAPKNQFNKFGGYKYRSLEDILEALKPLLEKHKCYLILTDDIVHIGTRYYVVATATLVNEKGEKATNKAFAREAEAKKGMDEAQITGAASSYARKYALNGLFAIDDTKDADAINTHNEEIAKINEEETLQLEEMIAKSNTDKEKFLKFFKVKKIEDMPKDKYEKALAILAKKIKKEKGAA